MASLRQSCLNQGALNDPGGGRTMRGASWSMAWIGPGAAYAHTMMPNEKNCHSWDPGDWYGSTLDAATSYHPGGVNVAMADGSVQFANETVAPTVWWAKGTRNGQEVQPQQ